MIYRADTTHIQQTYNQIQDVRRIFNQLVKAIILTMIARFWAIVALIVLYVLFAVSLVEGCTKLFGIYPEPAIGVGQLIFCTILYFIAKKLHRYLKNTRF